MKQRPNRIIFSYVSLQVSSISLEELLVKVVFTEREEVHLSDCPYWDGSHTIYYLRIWATYMIFSASASLDVR